ncbi:arginine-specific demethylase JMJ20-like isoform X1 [Primulina huaijiensis]|uniref:arginine-specific demethylase JMJ20-like isoform X1 n=1 Tax=Primulina huaijiensis TaxID=1492673 RepID=UPI003CC759A7
MGVKIGGKVDRVDGKQLNYAEFVKNYMARNQPVILTGLTDDWRACKEWVSADGKPDLKFLSSRFGASKVQVAECDTKEFTDQKRVEMSVSEFIDRWERISGSDDGSADGNSLLYLKDWHFVKEYPEYNAYITPSFFCDDWLNLYLDKYNMHGDPGALQEIDEISCSDYRFVYMGAKGTWTPLHADVFRSYSWSANVCGRKRWYFLSPGQHHLIFDRNMKSSVYNIFEDVCKSKFPGMDEAIWMECTQEQNEIIFVPSGWYHQVHNLEDTISINHNWFNAYNISWVWDLLLREYGEARWYIEDIKDVCDNFEGLCQKNLAANAGMDFCDLFRFMIRFAFANLIVLHQLTSDDGDILWNSSQMTQAIFSNLRSIRQICLNMKSVDTWEDQCLPFLFMEIIEDQTFIEFCNELGRTYCMVFDRCDTNVNLNRTSLEHGRLNLSDLSGSRICSPDELVRFVDYAYKVVGTDI